MSLPLELLGLFLAWVEIFHPEFNEVVEAQLDKLGQNQVWESAFKEWKDFYGGYLTSYGLFIAACLSFSSCILLLIVKVLLFDSWPYAYLFSLCVVIGLSQVSWRLTLWRPFMRLGIYLVVITLVPRILVSLILNLILVVISRTFRAFDALGKGRAIGGFGLTLGVLGGTGEVYQIVMSEDEVTTRIQYWSFITCIVIVFAAALIMVNRRLRRKSRRCNPAQART